MSSLAYAHPAYHGGKNHPEQVTDEFLCSGRRHLPPPPNPVPINRLAQVPKEVFIPTQTDRLLRRHNKARGRDDTLYNIHQYDQPCGSGGCCFPNNIQAEGYNGSCGGHYGITGDACAGVTSCGSACRLDSPYRSAPVGGGALGYDPCAGVSGSVPAGARANTACCDSCAAK